MMPFGNGWLVEGSFGFRREAEKSPVRSAAVGGSAVENNCDARTRSPW